MPKPVRSMRVRSLHRDFAPVGTERQLSMADGLLLVKIGRAAVVEEKKPVKQLEQSESSEVEVSQETKSEDKQEYLHRQMVAKSPRKG